MIVETKMFKKGTRCPEEFEVHEKERKEKLLGDGKGE